MVFVLDTSVTLSWCLADEFTEATRDIYTLLASDYAAVPALWVYELANVLILAERKNRITNDQISHFLTSLKAFDIRVIDGNASRLVTMSQNTGLTSYDAAYLDLCIQEKLPLATLDRRLGVVARQFAIPVIPA